MVIAKTDKEWIENNFVSATKLTALINDAVAAAIRPLQATIDGLTKTLNEKNKRIEDLENQLNESVARNSALIQQRADDNEQYSKKQNLKIAGIKFIQGEHKNDLEKRVISALGDEGVVINPADIFRLHHCGRPHPLNKLKKHMNFTKPTPFEIDPNDDTLTAEIKIRFTNWSSRSKVYDLKYQNSNLRVDLDITKFRDNLLKKIRNVLFEKKLRAYAYINSECKLVLNNRSGDSPEGEKTFLDGWAQFLDIIPKLRADPTFHKPRRNIAK